MLGFSTMTLNSGAPPPFRLREVDFRPPLLLQRKILIQRGDCMFICCCYDKVVPIRRGVVGAGRKGVDKIEEWPTDLRKNTHKVRMQATPTWSFASSQPQLASRLEKFFPHCIPRNDGPQSRDTPPKRDTGIANEKDWGINLLTEHVNESGINEDGSTWYKESGEDLGENGYKCRWARMGGQNSDGSSKWKEVVLRNLEEILKVIRGGKPGGKWEKYDAKGWTEKGAHKYGRLNEQSWWEKWGEDYDGRGSAELGTKWGDKWEERFFAGVGSRQGETWHISPTGERWSRTWGEEHFGNSKVHKYGKSTTGESWDTVVNEETYYEAEPHYSWADVIGDSTQLLSIQPQEKPPETRGVVVVAVTAVVVTTVAMGETVV
ncbi:hypothetical protein Ccrd_013913 [Cynara cardunculus var. scolymus]|uniref:Uncharacterized protein n=1 Tax=Cynara cardunculus var. scolymus TaxID=59895 RepID=A0A124SGX2_CYNCS|nr:hypothetical protein Ccrd_013913 [Cynara cardunculus var. scolymus]